MKKINKWLYGWKLYVNYGNGWEYEIFEETLKGYKENKKAYIENCSYPQKWTRSKEKNPSYKEETLKDKLLKQDKTGILNAAIKSGKLIIEE